MANFPTSLIVTCHVGFAYNFFARHLLKSTTKIARQEVKSCLRSPIGILGCMNSPPRPEGAGVLSFHLLALWCKCHQFVTLTSKNLILCIHKIRTKWQMSNNYFRIGVRNRSIISYGLCRAAPAAAARTTQPTLSHLSPFNSSLIPVECSRWMDGPTHLPRSALFEIDWVRNILIHFWT